MRTRKLQQVLSPMWSMRWTLKKPLAICIQLACTAAAIPLLYVCLFIHPGGIDDYLYSEWQHFPADYLHHYRTSGGRYFSMLLFMLDPLHWHSLTGYRIACAALLLSFILSFYRLIQAGLHRLVSAPNYVVNTVAALALLLMLANMTGISESFFWYTGAVVHTLGAILFAWLARLLILLQDRPGTTKRILLCLLCIAIMGTSELMMALCLAVLFTGRLYYRNTNQEEISRLYSLLLLVCIACALVYIAAPGNYARLNKQEERSLLMAIPDWLYFSQKFIFQWLFNPLLLLFSIGLIIITQRYSLPGPFLSLFSAFLLPIGIVYLLSLPVNLSLGTIYYPRVMNMIYAFFISGWIVFLLHLSYAVKQLRLRESIFPWSHVLLIAGCIAVLISLNTHDLRNNTLFSTYKGLARGIPQRYSAELNARYRFIQHAGDTVMVAPLTTKAGNVAYFLDITPQPRHEQNLAYAHYWGKKSIALAPDSSRLSSH
jgi:hypothetical protein